MTDMASGSVSVFQSFEIHGKFSWGKRLTPNVQIQGDLYLFFGCVSAM